jgi:predicted PurR-regulated permease PerM
VEPYQQTLLDLGLQVDLELVARDALEAIARSSGELLRPLQDIAFASLNVLGNLMFMIFLSLFIVIDQERILACVNQVTPPRFATEVRLFQTSVAESFGGFIRGQAIQGLV